MKVNENTIQALLTLARAVDVPAENLASFEKVLRVLGRHQPLPASALPSPYGRGNDRRRVLWRVRLKSRYRNTVGEGGTPPKCTCKHPRWSHDGEDSSGRCRAAGCRRCAGYKPDVGLTDSMERVYDWTQQFHRTPRRDLPVKAAETMADVDPKRWPALALLGRWLTGYETRYRRRWPGTSHGLRKLLRDVETLVERDGPADVHAAFGVIFTPRFKWVTTHMALLLNGDAYAKHVVPALHLDDDEVESGEQSEWRGERTGPQARKVKL